MEEDEYKTPNQSYYNMAHSSMERVTEQPTLLVGGSLKEYQVTAERMHYTNISNAVQVVFILGLVRLINYLCSTVSLYQMLHFEEQILCNFFARLIFVGVCVLASHSELKTDFCYLYSAKNFLFWMSFHDYAVSLIFTVHCCASAVLAMALCLCQSFLSQVGVLLKWLRELSCFLVLRLPSTYRTLCYKEIWVSSKMVLPSGTWSQTPDLENFATAS